MRHLFVMTTVNVSAVHHQIRSYLSLSSLSVYNLSFWLTLTYCLLPTALFLLPTVPPVYTALGTGTFGRVFLVKDKQSRGFYALKQMKIPDVIRLKQEQHVHNEKEVLTEVNHPFLIRL